MTNQRLKIWLLATATLVLIGLFGLNFLAGSVVSTQPTRTRAGARSLLPANHNGPRVGSVVLTVEIDNKRDEVDEEDSSSSDLGKDDEPSDSSSSDITNSSSSDTSDSQEAGRALRINNMNPLRTNVTMAQATSDERVLQSPTSVCDVRQPFLANCFKLFKEGGQERTIQRLAEAVGHLEIDEDREACSGVLLDGKSKTTMYFLTAARCLPNEKNVDRARIHFTGCAGTNTYTKPKVYWISRFLGYAILRFEANAAEVRATYGFLHLRATRPAFGEKVFIAHYAENSAVKRLTTTMPQGAITIKPFELIRGCFDAPKSRVTYTAPLVNGMAIGAPVISLVDGTIVALHMCGDCSQSNVNSGLLSHTILVDLDHRALEVAGFSQHAQDEV